ncbi:MAG: restriction endonuclease subunit S [Oscillospiraceae bacterium]|nr:restriction endonuclease subunit S [Oscillospiraceae bacterium]
MANWKYARIGDVCTVERGGSPRPIDRFITDDPNGINWIKIGDTDDSMYITKTAQKIIPEGMKKSRYVQPGDFLLSNSMSFGRPYILKIDGCIHDGWLVLRDPDQIFDKRFLYYYLSAPATYQKFKSMAVGGVVNNLNSEMVRGVTVPIPTMEEQLNIVDVLDKVTELISLRKEQLAALDQLVKSRFIELFGDCLTNPKGWKTKHLEDIAEVGSSKRVFVEELKETGIPFYRGTEVGALAEGKPIKPELFITKEHYSELCEATGTPHIGDLLMPSICPDGRIWVVNSDDPFYFKDGRVLWVHNIDANYNSIFLLYTLKDRIMTDYSSIASGTTFAELKIFALKKCRIFDVPLAIQNEFAAFIEQTDKSKLAIRRSLDELETLKKALMQKYFG